MNEIAWSTKWSKDAIKAMLIEQFDAFWERETGTLREQLALVEQAAALPHAVIISGLRRVGKSTLLAQLAHKLGRGSFYYVNFEDDRLLGFDASNANDLYQVLMEVFGERRIWIIDEVQNVPGWEHFVRRLIEMGMKFYITGSNASLLSRELGTRLTGRYVPIELFPFSLAEYLRFRELPAPDFGRMTTADTARINKALDEYARLGGIPDALKYPELPLLRTLYEDVLYRDIAVRHRIENVRALKEMALFLMSNIPGPFTYDRLKDQFGLGSVNTIKNYVDFLENSWLMLTANRYDYSVKRQQIAPKKVYSIDTGLAGEVGFSFSPNTGKRLENIAYLALRRHTREIYYYTTPNGGEVDFYLPEQRRLIQVTQHMEQPDTRQREIGALQDALSALNAAEALILTDKNAPSVETNGARIEIRSLVEWLLTG
jgi:predicted AAA+ superfamily ATPase